MIISGPLAIGTGNRTSIAGSMVIGSHAANMSTGFPTNGIVMSMINGDSTADIGIATSTCFPRTARAAREVPPVTMQNAMDIRCEKGEPEACGISPYDAQHAVFLSYPQDPRWRPLTTRAHGDKRETL